MTLVTLVTLFQVSPYRVYARAGDAPLIENVSLLSQVSPRTGWALPCFCVLTFFPARGRG